MGTVIGGILPFALGIAISPIPIIAAILMLLSPQARITGTAFAFGWVLGILTAVTAFTLLSSILPDNEADATRPIQGVIQILLGFLLLALALKQWRGHPKKGEEPSHPAWMRAIDTMGFSAAFGVGFVLAALNPKNLIMGAGAGVDIAAAGLNVGAAMIAVLIFTLITGCTVATPVFAYLAAADRIRDTLERLRERMEAENTVIMAVLLLIIGVTVIGKGIAQF